MAQGRHAFRRSPTAIAEHAFDMLVPAIACVLLALPWREGLDALPLAVLVLARQRPGQLDVAHRATTLRFGLGIADVMPTSILSRRRRFFPW
eukprot:351995-Prymnesium_polylepis.1